jgi:hypothetical protein
LELGIAVAHHIVVALGHCVAVALQVAHCIAEALVDPESGKAEMADSVSQEQDIMIHKADCMIQKAEF